MRKLTNWLYHNRIEIILLLIMLTALSWFGWLSYGLIPPSLLQQIFPTRTPPKTFSGEEALKHALYQCNLGPRPVGSSAHRQLQAYIARELISLGWDVQRQTFTYRNTPVVNLIAAPTHELQPQAPIALIGAHYDTRRRADNDPNHALRSQPVPGANDGASGVAVLLELARSLDLEQVPYRVRLAFFDAEDNGQLDGWDFIVGSTYMAQNLTPETRPALVIVVDMVGDSDQQLYMDRNSDPQLSRQLWQLAAKLGYQQAFIPEFKWSMLDDHTPFARLGIPAVDIIDFDYPYWHTTQDTCDKLSAESLERVGRLVEAFLESAKD
ncbi:MAG: M28 family peptidase [Anaerolineae bacterium]|nr:M28 family peptidase [Anaerolineae bacterium]MDW8099576.1 M28 family peptidase [Anaerolineae bacterium]